MGIKIVLADDHKIVLDGLRSLLAKHARMEVVGEANDGYQAVELARKMTPDVIIIDVAMPLLNGIEATRQIISDNPGIKVLALSMYSDTRFAIEMFKAGALGYLPKECAFKELVFAIETILQNKIYLSPNKNIAGDVVHKYLKNSRDSSPVFSVLTPKERQVVQLIAEGKTRKQIAMALFISEKTVETHHRKITRKLGLKSIAELTKFAIREGLTDLH